MNLELFTQIDEWNELTDISNKYRDDYEIYLLWQLFFTEFVQDEKLLGQNHVLLETTTSKFDTHDDLKQLYILIPILDSETFHYKER